MNIEQMIADLDSEIQRLQTAREALTGLLSTPKPKRGRPAGVNAAVKSASGKKGARVLSPEARKKIADAQKRRWAAAKRVAKA